MNWEHQLTRPVRTHRSDLPEIIRTLGDAVDMIDEHLAETLRIRPVWQQVKDMLVTAAETRTAQDVETATTLLARTAWRQGMTTRRSPAQRTWFPHHQPATVECAPGARQFEVSDLTG